VKKLDERIFDFFQRLDQRREKRELSESHRGGKQKGTPTFRTQGHRSHMAMAQKKIIYHPQEEEILRKWAETAASYRYLHNQARDSYRSLYTYFNLPVIILSTIAGTANFATASFPEAWRSNVTLIVGGINLISGLITTCAQFLDISSNLEGHRMSSTEFGKLSRHITIELSLPVQQRSMNGADFIKECRQRLDQLMEKSPNIPNKIVKGFGSKFSQSQFAKPDILEILPVAIYRNQDEELEKERRKLAKIREEEEMKLNAMRKAAEDQVKHQIEMKANEVAKRRHEMKKKKVSAINIADSMTRLISTMETTTRNVEASLNPSESTILEVHDENDDENEGDDNDSTSSANTVCTMDLLEDGDLLGDNNEPPPPPSSASSESTSSSNTSTPSKNRIRKKR